MCLCGPHKPKVLSAPAISRLSYLVKNIFDRAICDDHIARINRLTATTKPQWGKMNAAQMIAHCSKAYAMVCDPNCATTHKRPNAVVRFLLQRLLKPIVVGEEPYTKNSRTAADLMVTDERVLEIKRKRLIDHINQVRT